LGSDRCTWHSWSTLPMMGAPGALATALLLSLWSGTQAEPYSFLTLGDWGGMALGGFHVKTVNDVAQQMGLVGAANSAQFVVNVGDNFYYCGIQNTHDHLIGEDYTSVYTADALQVPWYSALGNHEYGYNVDAQVQFTKVDPTGRWYLPARYYTKRVQLAEQQHVTFIVLDTNPCIQDYRGSDPNKWDPCGSDFPTCAPTDEGTCHFHDNILTQDCGAQFSWFKQQIASVRKDDWLIVVGHHPADEVDVEDFVSVLEGHGFDLYLNGHVHTLQHYSLNGNGIYVTSGAGAMVRTPDQVARNGTHGKSRYESIWESKIAGFTLHTFSEDFSSLRTDFISSTGDVLHSFTVSKRGPSPSPSPSQCSGYPCQDGCTYIHKANEGACGVQKYGCYRCADLPYSCPECQGISAYV